ncbi:MAG: SprT-like domain-containing protein, partial [Candidatus Zixiibacteriota bacterium]
EALKFPGPGLPPVNELHRLFDIYNWTYFTGKLPRVSIEYSHRMTSAGSYSPTRKLIRISRKYHEIFPNEIGDTLKHEMLHIRHPNHDAAFKREAERIGASVSARSHPSLRKPPRYIYICPRCKRKYPRQKRFHMASCGYCTKGSEFDPRFKLQLYYSAARRRVAPPNSQAVGGRPRSRA